MGCTCQVRTACPTHPFPSSQVSDVSAAGTCAFFSHATTHDRAWVWKLLNKVCRGQTLITRTISGATFQATYKELRLDDR